MENASHTKKTAKTYDMIHIGVAIISPPTALPFAPSLIKSHGKYRPIWRLNEITAVAWE